MWNHPIPFPPLPSSGRRWLEIGVAHQRTLLCCALCSGRCGGAFLGDHAQLYISQEVHFRQVSLFIYSCVHELCVWNGIGIEC